MSVNSKKIDIKKEDIYKYIYFIAEMSQNVNDKGMYGTLSGKGDLMGGIFDRWINRISESIIFDNFLLPPISNNKKVEAIVDFYKYKPKQETTGIAPDLLGLKINNKVIPFSVFNEKWIAVENKPQIEVKTFKKSQKMVSLRDQGYEQMYLIMIEADYRVDYLLPFFDSDLFTDEIYDKMVMNDTDFIRSDEKKQIGKLSKVENRGDKLGTLNLLIIIPAKDFKEYSTLCEVGESPLRISCIEEYTKNRIKFSNPESLSNFCSSSKRAWKENVYCLEEDFFKDLGKNIKYLDFYCSSIKDIEVLKINKNAIYIKALNNCVFNDTELKKDSIYCVKFELLNREKTKNQEYFLQKELIKYLPNSEEKLLEELSNIISEV